jgi:hypothetical protein
VEEEFKTQINRKVEILGEKTSGERYEEIEKR